MLPPDLKDGASDVFRRVQVSYCAGCAWNTAGRFNAHCRFDALRLPLLAARSPTARPACRVHQPENKTMPRAATLRTTVAIPTTSILKARFRLNGIAPSQGGSRTAALIQIKQLNLCSVQAYFNRYKFPKMGPDNDPSPTNRPQRRVIYRPPEAGQGTVLSARYTPAACLCGLINSTSVARSTRPIWSLPNDRPRQCHIQMRRGAGSNRSPPFVERRDASPERAAFLAKIAEAPDERVERAGWLTTARCLLTESGRGRLRPAIAGRRRQKPFGG